MGYIGILCISQSSPFRNQLSICLCVMQSNPIRLDWTGLCNPVDWSSRCHTLVPLLQNHSQLDYVDDPGAYTYAIPLKGHLRSYNDVMRAIYVFARNVWLDWERDMRLVPKCSPRQDASSAMQHDLLRSLFDLDLRSHLEVDLLK